jgi:hypothetical protein
VKPVGLNDEVEKSFFELQVLSRDQSAETHVVQTSNELQKVLDSPHSEMVFVES